MTVRAVEGKKPYTGGKAIEITEDKVINLRLRAENNLIIYDEGDDEIYVDLQLPDGIEPLDTFPVGITTGRVLVDDDWDVNGTIVCFKTTSGDNIKLLYGDDGKLYIDNGTGLFKQIYLKGEVDALLLALRQYVDGQLALKQDKLIAGENITIAADGKTISAMIPPLARFLSIWDCETGLPDSFPSATLPFEYITGDHYIVGTVDTTNTPPVNYRPDGIEFDGTASTVVESADVQPGDVYIYDGSQWLLQVNHDKVVTFAQIAGQPSDNTNLATALNAKQDKLTAGANITIDQNNEISATDTTYSAGTNVQISNQNVISATDTTYTAGQNIDIDQNNEISVDYSWTTITISSGNATLTDTRCKLIPTGNFTLKAPSTVAEGQEYVLRCDNTTAYTMTLGTGITNPHNVDLTLSANATDQFIFLATPSGDLELQPAQLGEGTGISISNGIINNTLPGAIKSSTPPSNASQGDLWYDTTTDQLNSYDGSSWNPVDVDTTYTAGSGIDIDANNEITVKLAQNSGLGINASDELEVDTSVIQTKMYSAGSTAPSSPNAGDLWYDTTNDQLNSYDGTSWNPVGAGTGDVVGPSSATDGHLAVFDGATGKLLKDGGVIPVGLSSQANNVFTPGMKIWGGTSANYGNLTPDGNTAYLII